MRGLNAITLDAASDADLLAELLDASDLGVLLDASVPLHDLSKPGGWADAALLEISEAGRRRLSAAFVLARRRAEASLTRDRILDVGSAAALVAARLRDEPVEVFRALLLDARHGVLAAPEISRGTLSSSLVHPREVFRPAILAGAASVLIAHNHPSGDPAPSQEDDLVTERLCAAGELLGIPLLDHIVIGDGANWSYRERSPAFLQARRMSWSGTTMAASTTKPPRSPPFS